MTQDIRMIRVNGCEVKMETKIEKMTTEEISNVYNQIQSKALEIAGDCLKAVGKSTYMWTTGFRRWETLPDEISKLGSDSFSCSYQVYRDDHERDEVTFPTSWLLLDDWSPKIKEMLEREILERKNAEDQQKLKVKQAQERAEKKEYEDLAALLIGWNRGSSQ